MAERASKRYSILLDGFNGVYQRALGQNPGLPKTQKRAAREAYDLAQSYLSEEDRHLASAMGMVLHNAHGVVALSLSSVSSELEPSVIGNVEDIEADLNAGLRTQIERDVAAVLRALRGVGLRSALIARGRAIPASEALKIARSDADVSFNYNDRANRKWPSQKYVRTLWRHALVLAWNETAMLTMTEHGLGLAEIQHPDAAHAWNGERIALDETGALPTWNDVRDEVFHPNSEAWLMPVVQ